MRISTKPWLLLVLLLCGIVTLALAEDPEQPTKPAEPPIFTIYLIGDAGEAGENGDFTTLNLLQKHLQAAGNQSAVVFLGDNIYPRGLPDEGHHGYAEAEEVLKAYQEILNGYQGRTFFIPGNHDWKKGSRQGWEYASNQEKWITDHLDSLVFLPKNGCPGPEEINLNEEVTLILLNTQWFLHPWDKPRADEGCGVEHSYEVFGILDDIILRNKDKKVIVAGHHPLYSYGIHGGVTRFKDHIFPLTAANSSLYIPLPVVGSIYPFYRKILGNIQDINHPKYKAVKRMLEESFNKHPNLIYAAGHEHSLQYILKDSVHYVVSGSGAKTTFVKKRGAAKYAKEQNGFAKLLFYPEGEVRLEFWKTGQPNGEKDFEDLLFADKYQPVTVAEFAAVDFSDSTVVVAASTQYDTKSPGLFGENYRKVWKTPVEVPVFDLGSEKGGLKIIQRGGGQQTKSLRLEASDGKQYVLRSIEKYAEKAIPEALKGTIAADIVQDQVSSSHPYAAFVVPSLAESAGVYHTNPKAVFLPDDPRFGVYRGDFANTLVLYEERAAGNQKDVTSFGNAKKILSTPNMLEELYKDNDNTVDQQWVLKSRLFDMFLADWDRHDDQWRWASLSQKGKGRLFRPIPRDRDQAFFVSEGFFMGWAKRKWALPKFQGFDHDFKYIPGFNFNARYFDRDFLSEPSLEEWIAQADALQKNLTDEVIENAVKQWPKPVYDLSGEVVIDKLKSQRNNLKDYAREQYLFLAKAVNVRGSDKKEYFNVERLSNEQTRVSVHKNDLDGKLLYQRVFNTNETKEVRLYGLGGGDQFEVSGEVGKSTLIRMIGGKGKDHFVDRSKVSGWGKKTKVYDKKKNTTLDLGTEARNKTSEDPMVNSYNRKEFQYNKLLPLILASINKDDGLFLGGGFIYTTHGFRKDPFKSNHMFTGAVAVATGSFNFKYTGTFTDAVGKWDLLWHFDAKSPDFVSNFFGFGNETVFDQNADDEFNLDSNIDFYRIRFNFYHNELLLKKNIGESASFSFGHSWQTSKVDQDYDGEERFFLDNPDLSDSFFDQKAHTGAIVRFDIDNRDSKAVPKRGLYWHNDFRANFGLNNASETFTSINSELALFLSFRIPARITLATRVGAGHNFGDYEFYQAQALGGIDHVRGYRRTRYLGDSRFYNNVEMRMKLFTIRNPVAPVVVGWHAFHDVGRVWFDGEDSGDWHNGYGGGLWFAPLNATVLSVDLAKSKEETLFALRLGFLF